MSALVMIVGSAIAGIVECTVAHRFEQLGLNLVFFWREKLVPGL
jgi:hypothetical protein